MVSRKSEWENKFIKVYAGSRQENKCLFIGQRKRDDKTRHKKDICWRDQVEDFGKLCKNGREELDVGLECSGEGSDFSVGTMCQELSRSWREIVTHKTSQRLSKKVTVGWVQRSCRAGKNKPQKLRRTQASSLASGTGGVFSQVLLLQEGPPWQLCSCAAVQLCRVSSSAFHSTWRLQNSSKLPGSLAMGAPQHVVLLGRRSAELDPFLSSAGGWTPAQIASDGHGHCCDTRSDLSGYAGQPG